MVFSLPVTLYSFFLYLIFLNMVDDQYISNVDFIVTWETVGDICRHYSIPKAGVELHMKFEDKTIALHGKVGVHVKRWEV